MCAATLDVEDQLGLLLGELRRIEGHQQQLQTAVNTNKAIVVVPRQEVLPSSLLGKSLKLCATCGLVPGAHELASIKTQTATSTGALLRCKSLA